MSARVKKLTHFSGTSFLFDSQRTYNQIDFNNPYLPINRRIPYDKPRGFWLSDELDYGWSQFCMEGSWNVNNIKIKTHFTLDLGDVCVLDTDKKIIDFNEKYEIYADPRYSVGSLINWNLVARIYKGILISPYSYKLRLCSQVRWYYGWDCASACIWDLSSLTLLTRPKPLLVTSATKT